MVRIVGCILVLALVSNTLAESRVVSTLSCSSPYKVFQCKSGECVSKTQVCNGHGDCVDSSDEDGCNNSSDCKPPMWFQCNDGVCISAIFRCDDMMHCGDSSDELNCTDTNGHVVNHHLDCPKDKFLCNDSSNCLAMDWVCNGETDCQDGSDELHCNQEKNSNHHACTGFLCKNGYCITNDWLCDGKNDCMDSSDEANCTRAVNIECEKNDGFFPCKDKSNCVQAEKVCDGNKDCSDGSDEGGACLDASKNCVKANCSHGCFNTPDGAFCPCSRGYGRTSNTSCADLDECYLLHGQCSQRCQNHPGSYSCSCDEGYQLQKDNKSCIAEGEEATMVFSTKYNILGYKLKSERYFLISESENQVVGVAYDGKHVYWTVMDFGYEAIYRSKIDGSEKEILVKTGLGSPEDIVIDWYTGNFYFTDSELKHIGVCTSDGLHCASIISKNVDQPRAIVLNPVDGEMYWTDWGERPEIAKANMDGSNDKAIVMENIKWPNGLALDYSNDRLYWVDGKSSWIESVKLDGSHRQKVLQSIHHPYWLAVFEDNLYWNDWGTQSLEVCHKFTGKNRTVLAKVDKILGIHIYHPALAPKKKHACENNHCEYICLLSGSNGYTCACPEGKVLDDDKKRCKVISPEKYLIIGSSDVLLVVHHKIIGGHGIDKTTLPYDMHVDNLIHDYVQDRVIIYDDYTKTMYSIHHYSERLPNVTVLIDSNLESVEGLDFDYISRTLYWCDIYRKTVEVFSLETNSRATLLHDHGGGVFVDIALAPEYGIMFLAMEIDEDNIIISRMAMDGSGTPIHIIEHDIAGPVKMHYDSDTSSLYISNQDKQVIETMHIHGGDKIEYRDVDVDVESLTSLGNDVFWAGKFSTKLHWSNKMNTHNKIVRFLMMDVPHTDQMHLAAVKPLPSSVYKNRHPCLPPTTACSHICLISDSMDSNVKTPHHTHTCLCPEGMVMTSDNKTCEAEVTCKHEQFKCRKSNVCINMTRICDAKLDCTFGEDEEDCSKHKCGQDQFQCKNGHCISRKNRCDKHIDCPDKSDEENCDDYNSDRCTSLQFECNSGLCLDIAFQCDGSKNCPNGEDEEGCSRLICTEDQFQCKSGKCISNKWECDGEVDCDDASDEHNKCAYNKPCGKSLFRCISGQCIDVKLHCNKIDDCGDGSDELHCPTVVQKLQEEKECHESQYACETNTTICLPYSARCNGTAECPKGEDELSCSESVVCREHDEWKCSSGERCIQLSWRCDGSKDCLDGSDEADKMCKEIKESASVNQSSTTCNEGYRCSNGQCIDYSSLCDGISNCYDGTDENGKCENACKVNVCSDNCIPSPRGAICTCSKNSVLGKDGRKCIPGPPLCLKDPPPCDQKCISTKDSYICSCFEGYNLRADHKSCKAIGGPKSIIYMTNNEVRLVSNSIRILHNDPPGLSGLDIFIKQMSVFFSIKDLGQIYHQNYKTMKETVVSNLGRPSLIAVDWIAENVYFVNDNGSKSIDVCHMDKQNCAMLQNINNDMTVTAFTVDPINRLMFYSLTKWLQNKHPQSIIYQAHLDGSNIKEIVNEHLNLCSGLAVDFERKLLYFSDQNSNKIERINYELTNRKVIIQNDTRAVKPISLDIFENEIYFISFNTPTMVKCKLSGDNRCSTTNIKLYGVQTLKLHQDNKQKSVMNECSTKNCTHICVLGMKGAQCLCSDGQSVEENAKCSSSTRRPEFVVSRVFNKNESDSTKSSSKAVSAIIIVFTVSFLVLGSIMLYKYQKKKLGNTSNSDFSVRFQNPGFGGNLPPSFSVGLGSITSKFPNLLRPNQNEFTNPLDTKIISNDWPPNALDPKLLQLKHKVSGSQLEVPNLLGDSDSDVESDRGIHDGEHKEKARLLP